MSSYCSIYGDNYSIILLLDDDLDHSVITVYPQPYFFTNTRRESAACFSIRSRITNRYKHLSYGRKAVVGCSPSSAANPCTIVLYPILRRAEREFIFRLRDSNFLRSRMHRYFFIFFFYAHFPGAVGARLLWAITGDTAAPGTAASSVSCVPHSARRPRSRRVGTASWGFI